VGEADTSFVLARGSLLPHAIDGERQERGIGLLGFPSDRFNASANA
jgi:hypothetical protein